ncbi:MAG: DegT/DnrJ/EryC1/StrS family aminotransferase, partial [Actinomycetota bacterium]
MDVPYVDLAAGYRELQPEVDEVVAGVLESGEYVLGDNVSAFEREFCRWLGADAGEVVAVNSGTDAIYLTLKALGVGPGDEVVTVSHTAVNTALAISKTGARPVFVDIEPGTYCMDPSLLKGAAGDRTRAVVPVHLYWHPVDLEPVMEFAASCGIPVVEDCAQAHGATYKGQVVGTIGAAGCFSFYPTKNLGACGDGGAVVTGDPELAAKLRSLANCGQGNERYTNVYKGDVSRLDELQAAILRVKLKKLAGWNDRRREVAGFYREALAATGLKLPGEEAWAKHVYHLYVVRAPDRDSLKEHLAAGGVEAMVHYPV